jgi:CRP-like cAMP-binding protein
LPPGSRALGAPLQTGTVENLRSAASEPDRSAALLVLEYLVDGRPCCPCQLGQRFLGERDHHPAARGREQVGKLDQTAKHPLLDRHIERLQQIARRRRFAHNEVVFHRDDPGDSLHLIQKGRFAVRVMTPLADVATIAVRCRGESFGEMALVAEGSRRSATVAALEEAETFAIYRDEFERLRQKQPQVNEILFRFLAS